jgi:hypothetical protein
MKDTCIRSQATNIEINALLLTVAGGGRSRLIIQTTISLDLLLKAQIQP